MIYLTGRPINQRESIIPKGGVHLDTRERILEVADSLFAEVGYDAATTREIAERSGVNKALIHYHFGSKEGLLDSILEMYYMELTSVLGDAIQSGGNFHERTRRLIDAYTDFLDEHRNFTRTVLREASGGRHVDRVRGFMVPIFKMGIDLVHDEFPHARSGDLAAEQLLVSFYGMIISYFTYRDVLGFLTGRDPTSKKELDRRKKHLYRMLDRVEEALLEDEKRKTGATKGRGGKSGGGNR
ncbi:MAG: TetR/AcrR family transcriptional regulator [Actinobacteria bacterium]|nr:TetR/AcrR family transcriptional regulator [Actinomycetota bacterium]